MIHMPHSTSPSRYEYDKNEHNVDGRSFRVDLVWLYLSENKPQINFDQTILLDEIDNAHHVHYLGHKQSGKFYFGSWRQQKED